MAQPAILYTREWAMPNGRTFQIPPIRRFIRQWSRPGRTLDIFPFTPRHARIAVDGLDLLRRQADGSVDTALYDPVYSARQEHEIYKIRGTNYTMHSQYFIDVERELLRVVRLGGRVLKFMYNSKSIPGFHVIGGMLVSHGAQHNDTICTAYERVQLRLDGGAAPA